MLKIFLRVLKYARPYWISILLGIMASIVLVGVNLAQPWLMKIIIDSAIPNKDLRLLGMIALIFIALRISRMGVGFVARFLGARAGQRITYDLRTRVHEHMQKLSLEYFDARRTGKLMARVMGDIDVLQNVSVQGVRSIVINSFTLIIVGLIIFNINWKLALMSLAPMPVYFICLIKYSEKIHSLYRRVRRARASISASLHDSILGIRVVKAFVGEHRQSREFKNSNAGLLHSIMAAVKSNSIFYPLMALLLSLGPLVIMWYGGKSVIEGAITLGELVAFSAYIHRFYGPVEQFSEINDMIQQVIVSARRVFEVLDTKTEFDTPEGSITLSATEGDVRFNDVSFRYDGGKDILSHINLKANPGETIGLVGPTGSGKTTLVNLVYRFYQPREGSITIDGIDIKKMDLRSLRKHIAMVLQEPFLFHGTVKENIAYGKRHASGKEVIAAAKASNAHDFIMELPNAYDSQIGERGVRLSGGEKQRISIARAIIKNPRILILDEATSSVDTQTEKLIQEGIERLRIGRTTFVIAHRLSTVKNADRLIVLDKGKIVERGKHEELLKKEGLYSHLYKMQFFT